MLQDEITVVVEAEPIHIIVDDPPDTTVVLKTAPDVIILAAGGIGTPGDDGPEGPQGATGPQGPQGVQGPIGPTGPQGSTGTGILMKGSVATVGNLPSSGNVQGDAYIVQADDSLHIWNGSAWISGGSIQGPPGAQGIQGVQGPTGATGSQGIQGPTGATGSQGIQGPTGATGAPGYPTTTGAPDESVLTVDAPGSPPIWKPAAIPAGGGVDYIGNWAAPTVYKRGDVVRYMGNDYMAVNDSTGVAPPAVPNSSGVNKELAHAEIIADVPVAGTTVGAPTTIITAPSVSFNGTTPVIVEFYTPRATMLSGGRVTICLFEDGIIKNVIANDIGSSGISGTADVFQTVLTRYRFTPTAGAKVYSIRAFAPVTLKATIGAGNGNGGALAPAYLRIERAT